LAQEVERASKLLDDPIVIEYINHIARKITQNSDTQLPITIRVIDSDVMNAFTLPGGFLYVNRPDPSRSGRIGTGRSDGARNCPRGCASCTKNATKGELTQIAAMVGSVFIPYSWIPYSWSGYAMYQA